MIGHFHFNNFAVIFVFSTNFDNVRLSSNLVFLMVTIDTLPHSLNFALTEGILSIEVKSG